MFWPISPDYKAALQYPRACFLDPALKGGTVFTDNRGLPFPFPGRSAVVFQIRDGAQQFAVKCFTLQVTDQQRRYAALSQHLQGFWMSALVDFAYLSQGILVRGEWYPVVRMEWASGKPLDLYMEDNLHQGQVLKQLAAQWRGVIAGLRGAHTAHGDLQHGNIVVDGQGKIRLVDYDGFFIPALAGQPPKESGHPNYQHPERTRKGYYAESIDAFSALVIYLSLLAVKADPSLWTFYKGDNLIFRATDFQTPGQTPVWARLKGNPDAEARRLALELEKFCRGSFSAVPDLEAVLQGLPNRSAPQPPPPTHTQAPLQQTVTQSSTKSPPPTIVCPNCHHVNDANEIYCQHCTHQLFANQVCPYCQRSTPVKSIYCTECGHRL